MNQKTEIPSRKAIMGLVLVVTGLCVTVWAFLSFDTRNEKERSKDLYDKVQEIYAEFLPVGASNIVERGNDWITFRLNDQCFLKRIKGTNSTLAKIDCQDSGSLRDEPVGLSRKDFLFDVVHSIKASWKKNSTGSDGFRSDEMHAVLVLDFVAPGYFDSVEISETSGDEMFDNMVLDVVKSSTFPVYESESYRNGSFAHIGNIRNLRLTVSHNEIYISDYR